MEKDAYRPQNSYGYQQAPFANKSNLNHFRIGYHFLLSIVCFHNQKHFCQALIEVGKIISQIQNLEHNFCTAFPARISAIILKYIDVF